MPYSQNIHCFSIKKTNCLMFSEMITVCSENHTKHINTLCGQDVAFWDTTVHGT